MSRNNTVYVTVGPRGAGKSSYINKLAEQHRGLTGISRDEILMRKVGSTHTSPYDGAGFYVSEVMVRLLRRKLSTQTGLRLVLDTWTSDSEDRRGLIDTLKGFGANRIVALYFTTSFDLVNTWFWLKPGVGRMGDISRRQGEGLTFFSESGLARDYRVYHELAAEIDSDGFDEVIRIDPTKPLINLS